MVHVMNYQLAIFFKKNIQRPDQFFSKLNDSIGNVFDRMPQIIPMPEEVPPEIPRVSSSDSFGIYAVNVSLSRMDFTINVVDSPLKEAEALSDFIAKSKLIIKNIPSESKITRIGLIGNYFELDNAPAVSLARKLSKKDLGNVSEFNFRYNKPSNEFGFQFNNIYSISNAEISVKGIIGNGIFIQKDINNMPTDNEMGNELVVDIISSKIKQLTSESLAGVI